MNRTAFTIRTALRHLHRGGQRIWVALLCITFGVMSLVSMLLLSRAFTRVLVIEPGHSLGADLSMGREREPYILPEHEARLEALRENGEIRDYLLIAQAQSLVFYTGDSGEAHFASFGYGIDPQKYPLAGSFEIGAPKNGGAENLLQKTGDVLITKDLTETGLKVGDPIRLADLDTGAVVHGTVRGIVTDTPNHQGSKIYYTYETAEQLAGGRRAVNVALALADQPGELADQLRNSGWQVTTAKGLASSQEKVEDFIQICLKGAGILGLLVGGIGIGNTMQVLLRRRRKEIAIWKTIGYRTSDLVVLFSVEAAILGLAGSLIGAGLGLFVSSGLVDIVRRTGNMLLVWRFEPLPVLTGVFAGLVTTVLFAAWAILLSSNVPPLTLLRQEAVNRSHLPWGQSLALAAGLGLPFLGLTSLIMGSITAGLGVLIFCLLGLLVLGGLLGSLTWLLARLLAWLSPPRIRSAYTSLRRRSLTLVFAMIALFVGVVSLALGAVVTVSAQREMAQRELPVQGYNLNVIALAGQVDEILAALNGREIERYSLGFETAVEEIRPVEANGVGYLEPYLVAREDPHEYNLDGAPWGSRPEGVYTEADLPAGSHVEIRLRDGSVRELEVVGSYSIEWRADRLIPQTGLLMSLSLLEQVAPAETVRVFIEAPDGRVSETASELGKALPDASLIDLVSYAARWTQAYRNLFVLAVAMASLALLAGVLLVANSVSLAMLDRRYEIGVFKAIGYSRGQVLLSLVLEYVLLAVVASAAGLATVHIFLWAFSMANDLANLLMLTPASALVIGLAGTGLALLAVLGVTWGPTGVSPAVVLNDRE